MFYSESHVESSPNRGVTAEAGLKQFIYSINQVTPLFQHSILIMPTTKPFKEYSELSALLQQRNMQISDLHYAEKKLAQVGYYRLSGFWHTARKPNPNNSLSEEFLPNTKFEEIYKLYIFDKKLRLLILDLVERLEVYIRCIVAHEMGRLDPLAYKNPTFINQKKIKHYNDWIIEAEQKVKRSNDVCIKHHVDQKKEIPFWVHIEVWDFGTLSKYYSLLDKGYQNTICKRFNIERGLLAHWLREINYLRNCAAHHSRIWNRIFNAQISLPTSSQARFKIYKKANRFFDSLNLDNDCKSRLFSRIAVMWYLIKQSSSNYKWLEKLNELIEQDFPQVPNAHLKAMGIRDKHLLAQLLN